MFRRKPEDQQRKKGKEDGGHGQDVGGEHELPAEEEREAKNGIAVSLIRGHNDPLSRDVVNIPLAHLLVD